MVLYSYSMKKKIVLISRINANRSHKDFMCYLISINCVEKNNQKIIVYKQHCQLITTLLENGYLFYLFRKTFCF